MNKSKINWQEVALMIGGVILYFLYLENKDQKIKIRLLEKKLDDSNQIPSEVKAKLNAILENNPEFDEDVKKELAEASVLLDLKQESKAVFTLAKIIENLFKRIYKDDKDFESYMKSKNKKSASFEDYLDHAKSKGIISKEDYHYISALKIHRNREAHELAVFKEKAILVGTFLAGLTTTVILQRIVKKIKNQAT